VTQNPDHFLRDVASTRLLVAADRSVLLAASVPTVAYVATLLDIVASDPALGATPDWMATRDLSVHLAAPVSGGPVVVDARVVRVGSTGVVIEGALYDGTGVTEPSAVVDHLPVIGSSLITFARITRAAAPGMDGYDPGSWIGETRTLEPDGPPPATPYERMGLEVKEPGTLVLPLTPYVVNAIRTITGGAQAALAEVAAESLLPGLVATDVQLHFLAQLRSDHLVSVSRVVRSTQDHGVVTVQLLDGGDPNRVAALATVTLTR